MLTRFASPLSRGLPVAANRLIVARYSMPMAMRTLHITSAQSHNSRASFASVAPDKSISIDAKITPALSKEDTGIVDVGAKLESQDVVERRDHYWNHPIYTREEYEAIRIGHHEASSFSEYVALTATKILRTFFDYFTGYKHSPDIAKGKTQPTVENAPKPVQMTEKDWLLRIIFLETIAGVPGMVGGMIRHLRSLRKLEKEGRWIETLLEEAENERMHLMTFMSIKKPKLLTRMLIVGAQGIFCNAFFFAYLISPRTCHRFVGYLEEEAVITYTRCLADYRAGLLPKWSSPDFQIPEIAKDYWHLPENCTMEDLLLAIRADEAGHRHVNHTLAGLEARDKNPFTPEEMARNGRSKAEARGLGWEREELKL